VTLIVATLLATCAALLLGLLLDHISHNHVSVRVALGSILLLLICLLLACYMHFLYRKNRHILYSTRSSSSDLTTKSTNDTSSDTFSFVTTDSDNFSQFGHHPSDDADDIAEMRALSHLDDPQVDSLDLFFKCSKLEMLRADFNNSVGRDVDHMMSKALTFAFMDDGTTASVTTARYDATHYTDHERRVSATQIEANVLFDAFDWMKRRGDSQVQGTLSLTERQSHMQTSLNTMVLMVRQDKIDAETASRIIHNCAALLELSLIMPIPRNAIVVTGLRKTATSGDLYSTFASFGNVLSAAVADGYKGFALVRFCSSKTVERVLGSYRADEIVVKDVAVVIKLLSSTVSCSARNVNSNPGGGVEEFDPAAGVQGVVITSCVSASLSDNTNVASVASSNEADVCSRESLEGSDECEKSCEEFEECNEQEEGGIPDCDGTKLVQ
jgi:hypothetical protein